MKVIFHVLFKTHCETCFTDRQHYPNKTDVRQYVVKQINNQERQHMYIAYVYKLHEFWVNTFNT